MMTHSRPRPLRNLACCALLCALSQAAPLQDTAPPPVPVPAPEQEPAPQQDQEPEKKTTPDVLEALGRGEPSEDELVALFARVETRLREIDRMLYDASPGRPLEGAEESGIGKLLDKAQSESNGVLEDIDRILEIANQRAQQQQQQSSSGGGSGESQQQGGSPLDQQQSSPSEREATPDSPSGTKPEPQQPEPGEGEPEGPEESDSDPENRAGNRPPDGSTERAPAGTGNDAWGDLPIHVRELFRVQGGSDLPPRYRDWIDSYYRRLNQKP